MGDEEAGPPAALVGYHGDNQPYAGLHECTACFYGHLEWTDADVERLCTAIERGKLPKLEKLVLYHNSIGDAGASALAAVASKLPKQFENLNLENNPSISQEAKDALTAAFQAALPDCTVNL